MLKFYPFCSTVHSQLINYTHLTNIRSGIRFVLCRYSFYSMIIVTISESYHWFTYYTLCCWCLLLIVEVTNLFRWLVKAPSSPIVQSMMMSDKLMLYFKNKRKLFTSVTLSPSQCSHVMQREMKTRECHYDYASLASIIIYR